MSLGMTCPKCGLMQLSAPACKACGSATGRPAFNVVVRPSAPTPSASPATSRKTTPRSASAEEASALSGLPMPDVADKSREFTFHGTGGSLFGIHLVNMVLTILTLGIYRFWATVRVRRYVMSQTEFEGDRFAYHGTGKELWQGFTRAFALYWLPLVLLNVAAGFFLGQTGSMIAGIITPIFFLVVLPIAIVGGRRYRLSRTSWRGIRFSFRGDTREFVFLFLGGVLLSVLTLGIYTPVFLVKKYRFMTANAYFGTLQADFDGENRALLGSFLMTLLLTPFTLGLVWFWFIAKKQRYLWAHTTIGGARFDCGVTTGRLLALHLVNGLLLLVTLGLGRSWVVVRMIRFTLTYLTLQGPLDYDGVKQDAQAASATGEGLAGLLDAGMDIG